MLSSDKSLKAQLNRRIKALEKQLDSEMTDLLATSYKESYYHTRYEVQRVSRYHAFNRLDDQNLSTLLSTPWAPDGKNYSERIWGNTQTLANHLQRELTVAFVRGEPLQKTIQRMTKVTGASQSAVKRLVLTESAYFATTGSANAYKAEGVDEYEIIATLDSKTSEICRHMDGKHFPMDEISPGVNAPPFHCYCRSAIMPYFPGVEAFDPDTRAARDPLTGKAVKVVDVPYGEWKRMYEKPLSLGINSKGNNTQKEKIEKGKIKDYNDNVAVASPIFLQKTDQLFLFATRIKPLDGYTDIIAHGSLDSFSYSFDGEAVSPIEFAAGIRAAGVYKGGNIRLLACLAGQKSAKTGIFIAKHFGANVLAPNGVFLVNALGEIFVDDVPVGEPEWHIITPKGEYLPWK